MTDIFPPSNLPNRSEAWGRAVEGEIRYQERQVGQVSSRGGNWSRFTEGQLAVMGRNLNEITGRSAESVVMPNISVTGSATSEPYPRVDTSVSFSPADKTRRAFVTLSGTASTTSTSSERMYVFLLFGGSIIGGSWAQPFTALSTPVEWQNSAPITVFGGVTLQPGVPVSVTVRVIRAADDFSAGTSTLTLNSPVISLARSGAA